MDIMMPELDGFSACREIRKITQTPIIMLSARGEEYDKINGFEVGIDDYVVKPFSPKELMLRIEAVMKRVKRNYSEGVKKENVMKLCIGLELTLEQAKEFMASESYDFSPSKMLDVVIKSCLYHRIYNPVCVNIELAENGEPEFFVKAKEKKKKKK
jgi:DNA-binding response OmpR family regulator